MLQGLVVFWQPAEDRPHNHCVFNIVPQITHNLIDRAEVQFSELNGVVKPAVQWGTVTLNHLLGHADERASYHNPCIPVFV